MLQQEVGRLGSRATLHRLARRLTDGAAGRITHEALTDAAPTSPPAGTLHEPMPSGTGVSGGIRERKAGRESR